MAMRAPVVREDCVGFCSGWRSAALGHRWHASASLVLVTRPALPVGLRANRCWPTRCTRIQARSRDDDDEPYRGSRRRRRDGDELEYAFSVLRREWPRLAVPAIGALAAATLIGPVIAGAVFMSLAVASSLAIFAMPLAFVIGAGLLTGGAGLAVTVGFAGLVLLPKLLSLLAVGGAAVLGAVVVTGMLKSSDASGGGGSRWRDEEDDVIDVRQSRAGGTRQQGQGPGRAAGRDAGVEAELEKLRREAEDDLKRFDEVLDRTEKARRGEW